MASIMSISPLRILFVTWRDLGHPAAGGSEVVVDALARGAQDRGHEVALLCGGPVSVRDYRVVDSGGVYTQYLKAPFYYLRDFRSWDLVVDVGNGVPFFSPLYRQKPVICLVHHVHGHQQWYLHFGPAVARMGTALETRVVPALYRNRPFITVSPSTAEALEGIGVDPDLIHLVHNGVDIPVPPPDPTEAEEPLFLVLGRLAPIKRLGLALDCWEQVRERTGGRLVLAGDGPEYEALARRNVPGVELTGWISDERKRQLLADAWLLVHTAEQEGWGLVITEAAAAGTPALAFDVPGVRDAVVDGVTGELAADPVDLVERWVALAADGARRRRLGSQAQQRALQFTWDHTTDEFLKVAELAVQTWRRPREQAVDAVARLAGGSFSAAGRRRSALRPGRPPSR